MKNEQLFLSTIDKNAGKTARKYGLGLEIADFCTAINMDTLFEDIRPGVEQQVRGISNRLFHGPFNELFPCAIDPMARELAKQRFLQAGELAQHYGTRKIIFHGGYLPNVYFPCWYIRQSVSFWKELLQLLPGQAVPGCGPLQCVLPNSCGSLASKVSTLDWTFPYPQ